MPIWHCSNTDPRPIQRLASAAVGFTVVLGLSGCTPGDQVSCPDQPMATYIGVDVSETSRSEELRKGRLADIQSHVELTAICHGSLKVEAFSSGTGATATLLDEELQAKGATIPARQRHVDEAVGPATDAIRTRWDEAETTVPSDGTDVVGQLELMAEYFAQHPDAAHYGLLLTDGVQTSGSVVLNDGDVTEAVASELAANVTVPDLTGAELTIAGIGQVAGEPPPSSYVTALKRFYADVCARTNAECLVVTDLASRREGA